MNVRARLVRVGTVFAVAFALNLAWENLHAGLYVNYQGNPITALLLLKNALFVDATVVTAAVAPFLFAPRLRHFFFLAPLFLVVFAIVLEYWALATGRWAYTDTMPLIPLLGIGASPALQLGATAIAAFMAGRRFASLSF